MSRDRFVLYTLLGLLLIAVLGLAFMKVSPSYQTGEVAPSVWTESARPVASEPDYDFTTLLPDNPHSSAVAPSQKNREKGSVPSPTVAPTGTGKGVVVLPPVQVFGGQQTSPRAASNASVSAGTAVSNSNNLLASNTRPTRSDTGPNRQEQTPRFSEGVSDQSSGQPTQGEQILGAYMPKQTVGQQKALDQKLQAMSLGLDRAIAQAMAPKGKREQNLEKYMPSARRESGSYASSSGNNAAGAPSVSQRLASHAQQVVSDMRRTYGDSAAGKASEIMNDFQQEMASVLNGPADPQEKQIQAQQVNNKYNEKLRRLNEKEAREKLVNQLRQANEQKLAKIGKTFNANTETAARAKLEEYVQKRVDIMTAGYSEEDMHKQLLELENQQQKDLEKIIAQANPGDVAVASKLVALENEQARERLQQDQQDVQEGKKNVKVVRYQEQTIEQYRKNWQKENQNIVAGMQLYGPEVQTKAQQILNQATQQRAQILAEGGSEVEVQRKLIETTEQANAALSQLRDENKQVKVQNIERQFNEQNTTILQQYANHLQGASDQAKEAWMEQGRVVLEKYNKSRAQLTADAETNPNYKRDMQRLEESLLKELQQIQVPAQ